MIDGIIARNHRAGRGGAVRVVVMAGVEIHRLLLRDQKGGEKRALGMAFLEFGVSCFSSERKTPLTKST